MIVNEEMIILDCSSLDWHVRVRNVGFVSAQSNVEFRFHSRFVVARKSFSSVSRGELSGGQIPIIHFRLN